jgi:putative sugar O-methyltransferase
MPSTSNQASSRKSAVRRLAGDWLPPKVLRGIRRVRAARRTDRAQAGAAAPAAGTRALSETRGETTRRANNDPRWVRLTERTLAGLETCDPAYRPTNFWTPGVQRLLKEMDVLGVDAFKTWPEAFFWFYPVYGKRVPTPVLHRMARLAESNGSEGTGRWVRPLLQSVPEARRDYDVARMAWNHVNWPIDLESFGESEAGKPTQTFRLSEGSDGPWLTKPYLNYLLCLAGLSRHVSEPPHSFLELGGGFGVLGEILMSRDPDARYVNCDIPPLLTVASYYLTELFGHERVLTFDDRVGDDGPIEVPRSACLPNWRVGDLVGDFDVFVNSFSFQEMEPPIVEMYADRVAHLGVRYVVSLNSRRGKPVAVGDKVGVRQQVVSSMIVEMFERRGYELCSTYNQPLLVSQGELAVLRKRP